MQTPRFPARSHDHGSCPPSPPFRRPWQLAVDSVRRGGLLLLVALSSLAPDASAAPLAHGGQFVAPVPPNARRPDPLSPTSPSPTSPTTPAGSPNTPGSGAGSSATGGSAAEVDWLAWSWWWEFNKEPYLALRDRTAPDEATSTSGLRVTRQQVLEEILPALRAALTTSSSNDVVTGCLIALARLGDDLAPDERPDLVADFKPFLADANQELAETATIALGILGSESSAFVLSDLLLDTTAGHRLADTSEVSVRTRAFAAYALGLVGQQSEREDVRRFVVHTLSRALAGDESARPDVQTACVIALGRVPLTWSGILRDEREVKKGTVLPASVSREAEIAVLLDVFAERDTGRFVRAHIPGALAALVGAEARQLALSDGPLRPTSEQLRRRVCATLIDAAEDRRTPVEVQVGCIMALGSIGSALVPSTPDAGDSSELGGRVDAVLEAAADDRTLRNFALFSRARVVARRSLDTASSPAQDAAIRLRKELLSGMAKRRNDRARWSALALAVFEKERGTASVTDASNAVADLLSGSRSPLDVGAFSIAAGILGDPAAGAALRERVVATGDDSSRAHAAIGLALVGQDPRAFASFGRSATLDELRDIVAGATYRPHLLRDGSIALSLLGDRSIVSLLAAKLEHTNSLAALAGLARALGRVGDATSVAPVLRVLQDEQKPERARAFAAVALGLMSDRDALPWTSIYSTDVNYLALPATLYDAKGLGILNLL